MLENKSYQKESLIPASVSTKFKYIYSKAILNIAWKTSFNHIVIKGYRAANFFLALAHAHATAYST